jgi:cyclophilin family peptidyl-prolyl cis-trans isomerase
LAKQARKEKRKKRGVLIGVLVAVVVAIAVVGSLVGGDDEKSNTTTKPQVLLPAELPTELVITDLVEGSGEPAKVGDSLAVRYVGVLTSDGTEFDSNWDAETPFNVALGVGGVIQGWDQGLVGVKAGGRRQLDIPAELAYGDQGSGAVIKPGDALSFVIEVESITPGEPIETTTTQAAVAAPTPCPEVDGTSPRETNFAEAPPLCIDPSKTYTATVVTNLGEFTIAFDPVKAPNTVNNFVVLSRYHFFDGLTCHRIPLDFVAQCGDPAGDGFGGPGYQFDDELPAEGEYKIGSVVMANSGPNTNGSQFFIVTGTGGVDLPPNYSLFGQVTDGLDTTITAIAATADPTGASEAPTTPVIIESVTITES